MTTNGRSANQSFRPHLWLIKFIGMFGAAPIARRLAAGVGG